MSWIHQLDALTLRCSLPKGALQRWSTGTLEGFTNLNLCCQKWSLLVFCVGNFNHIHNKQQLHHIIFQTFLPGPTACYSPGCYFSTISCLFTNGWSICYRESSVVSGPVLWGVARCCNILEVGVWWKKAGENRSSAVIVDVLVETA